MDNTKQKTSQTPASDRKTKQAERTYVLDTSVLLSDPKAMFRFAEHAVVLPVIVITELESKR
ncbi:MAG: PIN domain-containing protein, partial [Lacisediminihabitans sp.]